MVDPSYANKHSRTQIETIVSKILSNHYPSGIRLSIDIDALVEGSGLVDDIVPIELLKDNFKVIATLYQKTNNRFAIIVDEDLFVRNTARTSFSIAHEFGHIILHRTIYQNCKTVNEVITLNQRIKGHYRRIETEADYFAGSILIPMRTIVEGTAELYEGLVKLWGYDMQVIPEKLCAHLAEVYQVTFQSMSIRLSQLRLDKKVLAALQQQSPYIDV